LLCTWRACSRKLLQSLKLFSHNKHLYVVSPVWTLVWICRFSNQLNAFWHTWHLKVFSPPWILLCVTRWHDCLNRLPQTLHSNGFSPEWISLCCTRWYDCVNRLLQTLHSNAFSPEWTSLCVARWLLLAEHLPHSVHLYLPLWIFICRVRLWWDRNTFSHCLQAYVHCPACLLLWIFNDLFVVNRLSHTVHKCSLGLSLNVRLLTSLPSASTITSTVPDLTSTALPTYAQQCFKNDLHSNFNFHNSTCLVWTWLIYQTLINDNWSIFTSNLAEISWIVMAKHTDKEE